MRQDLKHFFAELAGVHPSQIEVALGDEEGIIEALCGDDAEEDECLLPDFVQGASNIYRTKQFIVKQAIALAHHELESPRLISSDTYYVRTADRDAQYESIFAENRMPEGKRISTAAYFRTYRA